MKLLLIQPPFTIFRTESKKCHPPLGLAYLAAVSKQECEVKILDSLAEDYKHEEAVGKEYLRYGLAFKDIKERIAAFSPDVVGISCLFSTQATNVHKVCQIIKDVNKKIVTVLGGAHPSAMPEEVLLDPNVDFVVIGEGESTLKTLLDCLKNKRDFQQLRGIGFKINGQLKISPRTNIQQELDRIPFPYWDIFPLEKYFKINNPHGGMGKKVPFLPMITSRGCPFECIFCSIGSFWGKGYRKRSPENVLLELSYLTEKFGVKEILFEDDNLTLDKERARAIFTGMIKNGLGLSWSVPNGLALQTLDNGLLELMKQSGCRSISIGVESGDQYILKEVIQKPIDLSKVKPMIDKAKGLALQTNVFFVIGFPGENRAHINNTFRFAENLRADNTNFFFATPLPATRLLKLCKQRGLINGHLDYMRLKSDHPNFNTDFFSVDELDQMVHREKIKLYLLNLMNNPGKFLNKLRKKLLNDPGFVVRFCLGLKK